MQRYALIIDQFEEIITAHPGRWHEREAFFRQLDAAMQADPNLWVVLTLREDYVAALDPYAPLLADRLRARFLMEHMKTEAALDAIQKPAELAGRPFGPGVAEKLVNDLRQIRVAGQENTVAGEYVEPVQLEVVCYQLWENLGRGAGGPHETEGTQITLADLAEAGDVDRALTQFYEETLAVVLADPAAAGVSERQLRTWFDQELITGAGTRGLVHQGEADTGGLPNGLVNALQRSFLVRAETRGGNAWIELVHDRFVEPIRVNNAAWFPLHLSALQRQAALWDEQGRSSGLLFRGAALTEAETWADANPGARRTLRTEILAACREAQIAVERERRQSRWIRVLGAMAGIVAVAAIVAALVAFRFYDDAQQKQQEAQRQTRRAQAGELAAQGRVAIDEHPEDPDLAILVARHAISTTLEDGYVHTQASDALMRAMAKASPWSLFVASQSGPLQDAEFSWAGNRLATIDRAGNFHLWDTQTGKEIGQRTDVLQMGGCCIFFSHDGAFVVTGGQSLQLWDAATGEPKPNSPPCLWT